MNRGAALLAMAMTLVAWVGVTADSYGYGWLSSSASCEDSVRVTLRWTYYYSPSDPYESEWVGYDVYRRSIDPCSDYVRVNDEPFPRTVGATHSHTFVDEPPATRQMFQYRIVSVDKNRNQTGVPPWECDPCERSVWASCPEFSAPVTHGTLEDGGWALRLTPCPGSCYQSAYVSDGLFMSELRALAGTGTAVEFFGAIGCLSVEGCSVGIEHYEVVDCDVITPVKRASWGSLKLHYR